MVDAPKVEVYVMEVKDILKDLPKIIFNLYANALDLI